MCEGPNELEIINILLEHNKLKFAEDDLLTMEAFHARQINGIVKIAINLYNEGEIVVLRIGDTLTDKLNIKGYEDKIKDVHNICTKPEIEMLLIIAEGRMGEYNKVSTKMKPKTFAKENIKCKRQRYNNSTKFYRDYFENNVDLLVDAIMEYKRIKKHKKNEYYLADLLKSDTV